MKRILLILLSSAMLLVSCGNDGYYTEDSTMNEETTGNIITDDTTMVEETTDTGTTNVPITEYETSEHTCEGQLFVMGKDVSSKYYFTIDPETQQAEIPITGILRECGADIQLTGTRYTIVYEGVTTYLDTSEFDYGYYVPPGTPNGTRKIEDGEIIFEQTSASRFMRYSFDIFIKIDYSNCTISVEKNG